MWTFKLLKWLYFSFDENAQAHRFLVVKKVCHSLPKSFDVWRHCELLSALAHAHEHQRTHPKGFYIAILLEREPVLLEILFDTLTKKTSSVRLLVRHCFWTTAVVDFKWHAITSRRHICVRNTIKNARKD